MKIKFLYALLIITIIGSIFTKFILANTTWNFLDFTHDIDIYQIGEADSVDAKDDLYIRSSNENINDFVYSSKPVTSKISGYPTSFWKSNWDDQTKIVFDRPVLLGDPVEKKWNGQSVIFASYQTEVTITVNQNKDYKDIRKEQWLDLYAFIPTGIEKQYKRVFVDVLFPDGGSPEILSVFPVNADKDSKDELAFIISWYQRHYDFGGYFYQVFLYDDFKDGIIKPLEDLDKHFDIQDGDISFTKESEGGAIVGPDKVAKFKTEESVKRELKRLGF